MSPEAFIVLGGVFNLAFLVFHGFFWRLFEWRTDLRSLSAINRRVMPILNLCLMFVFAAFAYVSMFHAAELLRTSLGTSLLLLMSLFWWARAVEQVVYFGLSRPASLAFFVVFTCGGVLYAVPWYFSAWS